MTSPIHRIHTNAAFTALLTCIDTSTRELPRSLQKIYDHAMSRLPLTYPWASFILDLKDVLPAYDCHLIACLLANMVVGCVPYYSILEQLVNSFSISLTFKMPRTHRHSSTKPSFTPRPFGTLTSIMLVRSSLPPNVDLKGWLETSSASGSLTPQTCA